jgi:RNA polymerase sigma-70 factor (sigma-E family)
VEKAPASGDAFEHYVRQVHPRLRLTAYVLCGDWYAADDLVQDTLMVVYRRWPMVEHSATRFAYVRMIMVHLLGHDRRGLRGKREQIWNPLPELPIEADEMDQAVDRVVLTRALARLPARQRTVVVLHYWFGLDTGEVARVLSSPPGTVRSQLTRALATLRSTLQTYR